MVLEVELNKMKMNAMREKYWVTILGLLLLLFAVPSWAQITGVLAPLNYSVQVYSNPMNDINNVPHWALYPESTSPLDIQNGTATPLTLGTDYSVVALPPAQQIAGGRSYFRIQFSVTILVATNFKIGYRENLAGDIIFEKAEVLTVTVSPTAIGGNMLPLKYSAHTYSILMGDVGFTPNWGLYPEGTTAAEIEDGSAAAKALDPLTDYSVVPLTPAEQIAGGRSYWKIIFNRNIDPMTSYVIGYKETTADLNKCLTAAVQSITVQPAFDVDVVLTDPVNDGFRCGDDSDRLFENLTTSTTTIEYTVLVVSPATPPGYVAGEGTDSWSFDFKISLVGDGPDVIKNATIESITAVEGANTHTYSSANGLSVFPGDLTVTPASVTPVQFTVVYNEVLGSTQNVTFEISNIFGAFYEPDVDEEENIANGGNKVTHTIYSMPNVGELTALN